MARRLWNAGRVDETLRKAAENAKGFMPTDEGTALLRGGRGSGEALPGRDPRRGRHVLRQVDALPRGRGARGRQRHRRHRRPPHRLRGEPAGLGVARRGRSSTRTRGASTRCRPCGATSTTPGVEDVVVAILGRSQLVGVALVDAARIPFPRRRPHRGAGAGRLRRLGASRTRPAACSSSTTCSPIPLRAARRRSTSGSAPSPRASSRGPQTGSLRVVARPAGSA